MCPYCPKCPTSLSPRVGKTHRTHRALRRYPHEKISQGPRAVHQLQTFRLAVREALLLGMQMLRQRHVLAAGMADPSPIGAFDKQLLGQPAAALGPHHNSAIGSAISALFLSLPSGPVTTSPVQRFSGWKLKRRRPSLVRSPGGHGQDVGHLHRHRRRRSGSLPADERSELQGRRPLPRQAVSIHGSAATEPWSAAPASAGLERRAAGPIDRGRPRAVCRSQSAVAGTARRPAGRQSHAGVGRSVNSSPPELGMNTLSLETPGSPWQRQIPQSARVFSPDPA